MDFLLCLKRPVKVAIIGFFCVFSFVAVFIDSAQAAIITWDGGGGDNNWSTCANWGPSDTCPGASDVATFDATSTKNATIDAGFSGSVLGFDINSGYTGIITQAAGTTLNVGISDFAQDDGTFIGASDGTMNLDDDWFLNAGAFTAPGTVTIDDDWTINASWVENGGTFDANGGTIVVEDTTSVFDLDGALTINSLTISNTNNVEFLVAMNDTLTLTGDFEITEGKMNMFSGASINIQGDVTLGANTDGGTAELNFTGSNNQNFTDNSAGAHNGGVVINKPSGTVTLQTDMILDQTGNDFTLTSGTFDMNVYDLTVKDLLNMDGGTFIGGSGNITLLSNDYVQDGGTFTAPSGTFSIADDFTINAGTFNHGNGTIAPISGTATTFTLAGTGTEHFYNLNIDHGVDVLETAFATDDTFIIEGTFTWNEGRLTAFSGSSLQLQGDVVIGLNADDTTMPISFTGTANQSLTLGAAGVFDETITVNKSSGTVTLQSALTIDQLDEDLILTSGTFDLNGNTLIVNGTNSEFTVASGATLQLQGGETITTNGGFPTFAAGSTVVYTKTSGITTLKDYSYSNLTINGPGGIFQPAANETLTGNLVVSAGTLDVNDFTLAINGDTTISGGTLQTGTNTVTFGDAVGDAVTISNGTLNIESDATDIDIVVNAGTWTNSGGTISYTADSVSTDLLSALSSYNDLTIDGTSSTFTLDGTIDVNGNMNITAGTLDVSATNYDITVGGHWSNLGTFTARAGTVTFDDSAVTSIISGSTTFYDLTSTTAGKTITFTAATTQTVGGTLTITGAAGNLITLQSSSGGTAWNLTVTGSSSVDYVRVSDSDASGGSTITHAVDPSRSIDGGGNTNWGFNTAPTVTSVTAVQQSDGTVIITFEMDDADDDDTLQALVQYNVGSGLTKATLSTIDGDTTADFGDPKVNNTASYQVGTASGYITSSSGSNTITTVWVASLDESGIDVSTATIRITPYDGTVVGSTADSANFPLDLTAPTATGLSYKDTDADGTIDRIDLTFDEAIVLDECDAADYTIGGADAGSLAVASCATSGSDVQLTLSGGAAMDTNITITAAYTAANGTANSIHDAYANALGDVGATGVSDGAAPVISSFTYLDNDGDGKIDQITVAYSETVDAASHLAANDLLLSNVGDFTGAAFGTVTDDLITGSVSSTTITLGTEASVADTSEDSGNIAISSQNSFSLTDGTNTNSTLGAQSQVTFVDGAAPVGTALAYKDINGDGVVDRFDLTFTENIAQDECEAGDYTFGSTDAGSLAVVSCATSGTDLQLTVTGGASNDTNLTVTLAYTALNGVASSLDDSAGNAVADVSAFPASDAAAPVAVAQSYKDTNGDGTIDRFDITFSETIAYDECEAGDYTFGGADAGSYMLEGCASSGADLLLSVSGAAANDTNDALTVAYTAANGIANSLDDSSGNAVADISALTLSDAAAPVAVLASYVDSDSNGTVDRVDVTFSEIISLSSYSSSDWSFPEGSELHLNDVSASVSGSDIQIAVSSDSWETSHSTTPTVQYINNGGRLTDGSSNQASTFSTVLNVSDGAAPVPTAYTYKDTNGDGTVDRFDITFTEAIAYDECDAADYTIGGTDAGSMSVLSCATSGNDLQLTLSGATANDTSLTLTLAYTAANGTANSLDDAAGNAVANITATSLTDAAAPVPTAYTYKDTNGDGTVDRFDITFTEAIAYDECDAADYTIGGIDAGSISVSSCATSGNDLQLMISSAPANDTSLSLTFAYTAANGTANSLDDSAGNTVADIAATSLTDSAAPVVVSVSPTESATTVQRDASIVLTFSEAMDTTFAYDTEFTSSPNPGSWSAEWSSSDTVVTLTHSNFLCVSTITITTDETEITAASGAATALLTTGPADGDWSFTTVTCSTTTPSTSSSTSSSDGEDSAEDGVSDTSSADNDEETQEETEEETTQKITPITEPTPMPVTRVGSSTSSSVSVGSPTPVRVDNHEHTVTVFSADESSASLRVESEPVDLTLAFGEHEDIDTDGDGEVDTRVSYGGLDENGEPVVHLAVLEIVYTCEMPSGTGTSPVTGEEEEVTEVDVGDFIKSVTYPAVYYVTEDCGRRIFMNELTYFTWQDDYENLVHVTDATLSALPLDGVMLPQAGTVLVKIQSDPRVYALTQYNEFQPSLRWISDEALAIGLFGTQWSDYVVDVESTFFTRFHQGEALTRSDDYDQDLGKLKKRTALAG